MFASLEAESNFGVPPVQILNQLAQFKAFLLKFRLKELEATGA